MHGNIENIYNKDAINGIMTNFGYSVYIFLDMKMYYNTKQNQEIK